MNLANYFTGTDSNKVIDVTPNKDTSGREDSEADESSDLEKSNTKLIK